MQARSMNYGREMDIGNEEIIDEDDHQPQQKFGNFRNEHYSNAYGNYNGGYGGFWPGNYGDFGPMNVWAFGPQNDMNFGNYGPEVPNAMGRGFGLGGPYNKRTADENKIYKFLRRCKLPTKILNSLPNSVLQLMQPERCGLCGQDFNTPELSRVHYMSKNHQRNCKKMTTEQHNLNFRHNAQLPFKSRAFYCELCDVHITSKVHAESHYAGRSHRAIVLGRKVPRNPTLLQEHMAIRVEQLIRREKRFMKFADDVVKKESATVTEPKTLESELYCKICKTLVTCTEQMTMHLNGKRHLAKEKQHILNMMKCQTNSAEGNETAGENDGKFGENSAATTSYGAADDDMRESSENQEQDNYDWGNGGSTWEDEPEIDYKDY